MPVLSWEKRQKNSHSGASDKIPDQYSSNCQGQPIKESWITSRLKDSKDP